MTTNNLQLGQEVLVTIERLGIYGEGIAHWNGYTLFIEGALPGEEILARLIERKRHYGRAEPIRFDKKSPERIAPVCPLFGTCGGCQLMHLDYPSQLAMKRQNVLEALVRIGKWEDLVVLPCVHSPDPLHYRNKIQVPIRPGSPLLRLGFHRRHSHDLVDVEFCYIHCQLGQRVYEQICALLKASALTAYDWSTHEGELRYLMIKSAIHTGQVLVVFVTNGPPSETLRNVAQELIRSCPEIKAITHQKNTQPDNVVQGQQTTVLEGQQTIQEKICGLLFHISSSSFFQVNALQAENLYQQVVQFAALTGTETVLDAFCGVGTLSLILAQHAKQVIGVECVAEAIEDARKNAQNNGISNAVFVCAHAEDYIQRLRQVDVVILNPPRKGCEGVLLERLGVLKPRKIVYVSCDPATLARDSAILREHGYKMGEVQPFDMFPQTAHVETATYFYR